MQHALSAGARSLLAAFVRSNALLAFDFDGTLAPLVADPSRARMDRSTFVLLRRLAALRPCLVVSGRSLADLRPRLAGTGLGFLIGNHGAEPWNGAQRLRRTVAGWARRLTAELPPLPGVRIEDKSLSLTVHYRHCPCQAEARAAILGAAAGLPGVRVVDGIESVALVSRHAPHKGEALRAAMARFHCRRALYVGDDCTDEDVFAIARASAFFFSVRVGRGSYSRARFFLRGQNEMSALLRLLVRLCSRA